MDANAPSHFFKRYCGESIQAFGRCAEVSLSLRTVGTFFVILTGLGRVKKGRGQPKPYLNGWKPTMINKRKPHSSDEVEINIDFCLIGLPHSHVLVSDSGPVGGYSY